MIIKHREDINSNFEGTIIDIETIGEFRNQYPDSRRYKHIKLVIFGFIDRCALQILCAKGMSAVDELKEIAGELMENLGRPFYSFNSEFERGVLFYELGKEINFDGELQATREAKAKVVRDLGIPNYDDPFYDRGLWCMNAWYNGELDAAIAHNRACLLKERDILVKRGCRKPNELKFVK